VAATVIRTDGNADCRLCEASFEGVPDPPKTIAGVEAYDASLMKEEVPVELVGSDAAAERLEASLAELEREKRVVETLYRVAQTVAREDDLHEIVQVVTDETTEIVGAQFGAFFYNVVGRDGDEYSLYTISGVPRSKFASFPMPRATDIFRPTFEGTAIVRLDDVAVDPRFGRNAPYHGMPPGHLPVRSYLAVPVFIPDGTVVGGLFFGHPEIGVFSAEDEQIAAGISTQAGTAIAKARLLAAERDARAEAEARSHAAIALEYVDDGIAMVDNDGVIRLWNRAAARITGLTDSEVVGRPIGEAVPGWERIALEVPVGDWTSTSRPQTLPLDAHDRELWLSVYGVGFPGGTVYGFRNVTDERELEELRVEIVATVSHELRTPVAAVYGAARTLQREDLPPERVAQLFEMITTESERLTALVDQILLTSQIDSGNLASDHEAVDPLAVAEAVVQNANVVAARPVVVLEAPKQVAPVHAERERVAQVLSNLVENAVKYGTPNEASQVHVRVVEAPHALRVEVADVGPGVPESEQDRIFEKFYRLDPDMKGGVRGTGLGLYISRELVERMGGRIGIESGPGGGSTFWFELPRLA
jgi:signal transduction histidine kinase